MMKKALVLIALSSALFTAHPSFAATIPAGTTLVVRTVDTVSSHVRVGKTFRAQLGRDVAVEGKVCLKAGTPALGKIEASRANPHTSSPLTLNLTSITVGGRNVAITTTGGVSPDNKPKTARQSRRGVSVGSYSVPAGTQMEFLLARPINL
jgi:hypothetical protein